MREAIAALNPSGDFVSADLFYGSNAENATGSAADQVAKWKKLGNSLLLRLGMRYSRIDPSKAETIVSDAVAGGVMTSNEDNAYVKYDGTLYTQTINTNCRSAFCGAVDCLASNLGNSTCAVSRWLAGTSAGVPFWRRISIRDRD